MKINFLTTKLSGLTGGVIYDEQFYKKLSKYFPDQVKLIEDQNFGNEYEHITPNFRRYLKIYKKHIDEILDCDYLIINSRLYTRFIGFPWTNHHKCKIFLIHHHFNFMTHCGLRKIVHKYFETNFLRHAYCLITPNPYTKEMIGQVGLSNRVVLLEAFICKEVHKIEKTRHDVISFIGTVEPRKGLHLGILAFKKFSESHPTYLFKIAGNLNSEKYTNSLKKMIRGLDLENKVIFLGRIDEEQKKNLYEESKCFLFPSQNEGYGLVLIEAMSYGLPVVAFNNTAMPYTVNNTNGRIISNQDIDAMGDALSEIVDHYELYCKLQQGAYNTVKNLPDIENIEAQYTKFFQDWIV